MTDSSGWTPAGIIALVAIVAGIALLVVYAVRRGLPQRELDGTDTDVAAQAAPDPTSAAGATAAPVGSAPRTARRSTAGRPVGALGAVLLGIGLVLGVLVATGTWGADATTAPPAGAAGQQDCAAGWDGCPKPTAPTQP